MLNRKSIILKVYTPYWISVRIWIWIRFRTEKGQILSKIDQIWAKLSLFNVIFYIDRRFRSNLTYFWYKSTYFRYKSTVFDWIIDTRSFLIDLLIDFISKKIDLIKNRSILDRIILKINIVDSIKLFEPESTIFDNRIRISDSIRQRRFDSDSLIALA